MTLVAGYASRPLCAALAVMSVGLASCSALLDWSGYGGGESDGGAIDAADAATEAEAGVPACSKASCGGCCDSTGFCAGGTSPVTCGVGGHACQDCSASGQACHAGACVAPTPDAAPPTCTASMCTQCIPVIQTGCCTAAHTCGCQYVPAPGTPTGCR